jgi:hypothetical protein
MESMLEDSEKQKQEKQKQEKQDDKIEKHDKKEGRPKMKKNKFPTEESLTDDKGLYDGRRD